MQVPGGSESRMAQLQGTMEALQKEVEVETVKLQAPRSSESRESRSQLQGDIQAVQKEMASLISQAQPPSQSSIGAEATCPSLFFIACFMEFHPGAAASGHALLI